MSTNAQKISCKLNGLPGVAAIFAFIACSGMFVLAALFSLFGISMFINPHIQAAVISLFALLTFLGYKEHHVLGPVILAIIGAVLIIVTMHIDFGMVIKTFGPLMLISSAISSWCVSKAYTCADASF